jgi:hypothetical protein
VTFAERCELARRLWAGDQELRRAHLHPDLRVVTRDGELRGAPAIEYILGFFHADEYTTEFEPERFFDAGDGRVVAFLRITHHTPDAGDVRMWTATVFVMDDDGMVRFLEGYPDRDKALRDTGLA